MPGAFIAWLLGPGVHGPVGAAALHVSVAVKGVASPKWVVLAKGAVGVPPHRRLELPPQRGSVVVAITCVIPSPILGSLFTLLGEGYLLPPSLGRMSRTSSGRCVGPALCLSGVRTLAGRTGFRASGAVMLLGLCVALVGSVGWCGGLGLVGLSSARQWPMPAS